MDGWHVVVCTMETKQSGQLVHSDDNSKKIATTAMHRVGDHIYILWYHDGDNNSNRISNSFYVDREVYLCRFP